MTVAKEKPRIGILIGTFNEEENVVPLFEEIEQVFSKHLQDFIFEVLFIDNASTDKTRTKLRELAKDKRVKCIFNSRNFGTNRSSFHGILNTPGDAVIMMCADFQDPPEMLVPLVRKWYEGSKVVMARKRSSDESFFIGFLRKLFYLALRAGNPVYASVTNCTGFGIYDRSIVDRLSGLNDRYPFFRGIIEEITQEIDHVYFDRPARRHGQSKMNFMSLWDEGVVGLINNSKLAIRMTTIIGVAMSTIAILAAFLYFVLKLIYWEDFPMGIAPMLILQFLLFGALFFILGILGEYVGAIYTQVLARERVYEVERLNFSNDDN